MVFDWLRKLLVVSGKFLHRDYQGIRKDLKLKYEIKQLEDVAVKNLARSQVLESRLNLMELRELIKDKKRRVDYVG